MINALEVYRRLKGEYDKTDQPLQERSSILPFGQYEDGSVGLAWPEILAAPAEGIANFGQYGYGEEAVPYNSRMAFDAAGGAMTGGLATGVAGGLVDNALGSAGGKLTQSADLPMDLASRMARAKEMGFDVDNPVYHGTNAQFEAFKPSDRGALGPGVYFSKVPGVAENYGTPGEYMVRGNILNTGPFRDIPDGLTDAIKSQLTPDEAARWDRMWPTPRDMGGYTIGNADAETLREVLTRSVEPARVPEIMRAAGYDGMQGIADGHELTIFDPRNIRSVNAAFDPAKSDSANLLAANAKTGATVPLALNALERAQPQGIRAYHGSPHDFDRFSLDKIGTGEGAQAYGHGLYFTDTEDVAKFYRDSVSDGWTPVYGGQSWDHTNPLHRASADLDRAQGDRAKALREAQETLTAREAMKGRGDPEQLKYWREVVKILESDAPLLEKSKGRMYEVNIKANPEDFLDWDKPLSQQSEAVRRAFPSTNYELTGADAYQALKAEDLPPTDTGNPMRDSLAQMVIALGKMSGNSRADISAQLREAGIPGIKYLDGMSRGAGEGSSNYVVFDDALVDILRKYANAPTGAAIPAGMEASDTDPALLEYLKLYGL